MPRYTKAESTLTRSTSKRSARCIANAVLPYAVGPIRKSAGGRWSILVMPAILPARQQLLGGSPSTSRDRCTRRLTLQGEALQRSAALASKQQHPTEHDCADTGPDRHIDRLLFLHRELNGTDLGLVIFLGVAKTAVRQTQGSADNQHECQDSNSIHCCFLLFEIRDRKKYARQ